MHSFFRFVNISYNTYHILTKLTKADWGTDTKANQLALFSKIKCFHVSRGLLMSAKKWKWIGQNYPPLVFCHIRLCVYFCVLWQCMKRVVWVIKSYFIALLSLVRKIQRDLAVPAPHVWTPFWYILAKSTVKMHGTCGKATVFLHRKTVNIKLSWWSSS